MNFNIIHAQLFSKKIEDLSNISSNEYNVISVDDFYVLGMTISDDATNDFRNAIAIGATDFNAEMLNAFLYATSDSHFSISCEVMLPLSGNNILVSGTYASNNSLPVHPFLMSVDVNGTINWAKYLPDYTILKNSIAIKLLSDTSILYSFKYNDGNTHQMLLKVDASGTVVSSKELSFPFSVVANIIPKESSFDLLLANGNLIDIENDLSTINNQKKYTTQSGINSTKTANGDYIIASAQVVFPGHMTISRFDTNGNQIWSTYIESWSGDIQSAATVFDVLGIHFVKETTEGNIVVAADSEGGFSGSFIVELTSDGTYVSNYKTNSLTNKTFLLPDDQFLISGFANHSTTQTSILIEKRDLISELDCDTVLNFSLEEGNQTELEPDDISLVLVDEIISTVTVSVDKNSISLSQADLCDVTLGVGSESVSSLFDVNLYPNPAQEEVYVSYSLNENEKGKIMIYDVLGNIVYKGVTECNGLNNCTKKVDVSTFSNGIYLFELQLNNTKVVKKVIVNK